MNKLVQAFFILIILAVSANAATISGTASYSPDFGGKNALVGIIPTTDLTTVAYSGAADPATGNFSIIDIATGAVPYLVFVFLDQDANLEYTTGEPYGIHNQPVVISTDTDYPLGTITMKDVEVTLTATIDTSINYTVGDSVTVDITADDASNIAGGAFTVAYDSTALSLTDVQTTFFDTFANQWAAMTPPPSPTPPTSVDVDGEAYTQPSVANFQTNYVRLAAARVEPPGGTPASAVIATLTFQITANAGDYTIGIGNSYIDNTSAGYAVGGEFIPMLTGSNGNADLALAYPTIHAATVAGTISVGCSANWSIYDADPSTPIEPTISSVEDDVLGTTKCVTQLSGNGTGNGYRYPNLDTSSSDRVIEWNMKYGEWYIVYVDVTTNNGKRYLFYSPNNDDELGSGTYLKYGLGSSSIGGTWKNIKRNIAADVANAQPGTVIISVNAFMIRGSGRLCDISLGTDTTGIDSDRDGLDDDTENTCGTDPYEADTDNDGIDDKTEYDYWVANAGGWNADSDGDGIINILELDSDNDGIADGVELLLGLDPGVQNTEMVYEDGESGAGKWSVYDNNPSGATVSVVDLIAEPHGSNVIELSGTGTQNGYKLTKDDGSDWNNSLFSIIEWDANFSEFFIVYVSVETDLGNRFLMYKPIDQDLLGGGEYIQYGLGANSYNGLWSVFKRNIAADLENAQPGNSLIAVNGFYIRGSGQVDNILLTNDNSGIDSDRDGLTDDDEATWASDPYDADTDDDGISDGDEVANGTNPIIADVTEIVFEDGSGDASKWSIYDNDPVGATVSVVSGSIQLSGDTWRNGYRLNKADGGKWLNDQLFVAEWKMQYSDYFMVYFDVETDLGHRYFVYSPKDSAPSVSGEYISIGLGYGINNGTWQTITRDLQDDLSSAESGNTITEVNSFLIRGSGLVDDIKLMDSMP